MNSRCVSFTDHIVSCYAMHIWFVLQSLKYKLERVYWFSWSPGKERCCIGCSNNWSAGVWRFAALPDSSVGILVAMKAAPSKPFNCWRRCKLSSDETVYVHFWKLNLLGFPMNRFMVRFSSQGIAGFIYHASICFLGSSYIFHSLKCRLPQQFSEFVYLQPMEEVTKMGFCHQLCFQLLSADHPAFSLSRCIFAFIHSSALSAAYCQRPEYESFGCLTFV